jgi:hypothetical protein
MYKTYAYTKIHLPQDLTEEQKNKGLSSLRKSSANEKLVSIKQPDLLYMEDILVSTGSNLNDDVFLPEEVLDAVIKRKSVALKPVNWEHNPEDIIGTMFDSFITDLEGNKIEAQEGVKDFHVVSLSVIWKAISESHFERAQLIAQASEDNSLFVSMEAFFSDFDFLVGNQIIRRNEETNFLSTVLRANGGPGEFQGQDVKRVLRDITFAIDLDKIKIPESNIIGAYQIQANDVKVDEKLMEKIVISEPEKTKTSVSEEKNMTEDRVKELEAKLEKAEAEKAELAEIIANLDATKASEKIEELESKKAEMETQISDLETKLAENEKVAEELEKTKASLDEAMKDNEELKSEIEKRDKDARLVSRKTSLAEVVNLEDEDLEKELAKVRDMSDEDFEAHMENMKFLIEKGKELAAKAAEEAKEKAEAEAKKTEADKKDGDIEDILSEVKPDASIPSKTEDAEDMKDSFRSIFSGK